MTNCDNEATYKSPAERHTRVTTDGKHNTPSRPVDVSVIIVATNERDLLEECLRSLYAQEYPLEMEVIVIDNKSSDGTHGLLERDFPHVQVVRAPTTFPRSTNNNLGSHAARGRYVLFLDPDTRVLPGAIETMVRFMDQNPEAGICGCRLIDEEGQLQMSCRTWQTPLTVLLRRTRLGRWPGLRTVVDKHLMANWDHASIREVDWVQGAAITVRREAIDDVGLMDGKLLRYSEDIDWCFRFWKLGWKVFYVPDATIVHAYRRESNAPLLSRRTGLNKTAWLHLKGFIRLYYKQAIFPLIKRGIDLIGAFAGLLLLGPLMLLIALSIRLDSPGCPFYFQERVGRKGRRFRMCKFRSMGKDAEIRLQEILHLNEVSGPVFKIKDDPRITRVGRFLRRWSLDELPQMINVLRGEMSLVGPRPLPPFQIDTNDMRSMRRLNVTPGLSGLWQVSGRSDIEFERWIDLDIRYIAEQSLTLDLYILARTFPAVTRGRGAY